MPDPVAPEIQGLTQPAPTVAAGGAIPAPSQPAPPAEALTPGTAAPDVTDRSINPTVPPAAPVGPQVKNVGGHTKLLALVQGLADGLSAASASIATHGREGGAEAVQQLQAQRQQMKQSADTAAQAKAAAAQDYAIKTQTLNMMNMNSKIALATFPDEIAQSHLKTTGEQQIQAITGADFQAAHGGMTPTEFSAAMSSPTPVQGGAPGAVNPFFLNNAQSTLRAAQTANIPPTNPAYQRLSGVLADPKATPKDVFTATQQMQAEQDRQGKAVEQRTKQEAAEAGGLVGKLSTPEALAAPGAQAAIQARIDDPATTAADVARLRTLLPQAAVAQLNAETMKAREARNQQIVNQGDPDEAGRLLANRSLTLGELKSRQVTPKFIADAITSAQKYDPTYKAAEAEAQGKIAASPANSQFFGNTDSLLVRGGTLDQLDKAYATLGNTQIPVINKLDNLRKAAVGSGPLAAAYAAQLGVADDYSKVMSGGTGSDTSRQQALDIMSVNLSPEARPAAIKQIRQAVTSQRNGRVGTNPYMRDMYPDPSTRQETPGQSGTQAATPAGASSEVWVGGKLTGHVVSNKYVPLGQ